jgi:CRP-like cAMP-binding protein
LLARIPFFREARIDLAPLEKSCRWKRFDPDEVLVDFEDETRDVYFIAAGEVRILIRTQSGKEVILGEMRAGQFFGELAAIDGIRRSANVTGLTRGEVGIMSAKTFRDLIFHSPELTDRLLRLLTCRVRELNARLMEAAVLDVRHRLYAELLRLSVNRVGHEGQRVVTPPPYHHVLAARIGCRREQVTREFTTMAAEGLIERSRGALVLPNPHALEERVVIALRDEG